MFMDQKVLILNQDYSAISLCSIHKAFILLFLEKAELVEKRTGALRTISKSFPVPSIIRLQRYVNVPYKGIALSRQNIMRRDHFRCLYCDSTKNLTIDHIIPRSRGGESNWTNLGTACMRCNTRKGDRTPEEANMLLKQKPKKPSLTSFLVLHSDTIDHSWHTYLRTKN